MNKRIISLILCVSSVFILASCGKKNDKTVDISREDPTAAQTAEVDINLASLSNNLAYSEVYNMCASPEEYDGKTIRLSGLFSAIYENVEENDLRFTCQISDATACCSVGLEFVPKKELVFPDDFPLDSTKITVTGTLKTKSEDVPIYISDAEIQY